MTDTAEIVITPQAPESATSDYAVAWGYDKTPDLIGTLTEAQNTAESTEIIPTPSAEDVDNIMAWLADPDALDWDHLERIDSEGWNSAD